MEKYAEKEGPFAGQAAEEVKKEKDFTKRC